MTLADLSPLENPNISFVRGLDLVTTIDSICRVAGTKFWTRIFGDRDIGRWSCCRCSPCPLLLWSGAAMVSKLQDGKWSLPWVLLQLWVGSNCKYPSIDSIPGANFQTHLFSLKLRSKKPRGVSKKWHIFLVRTFFTADSP